MSQSLSFQGRAVVDRSRYARVQRLLLVAVVAVVGLTVAVIILATSQNSTTTFVTPVSLGSSSAGNGQSAAAQVGATLDHRGLDTSQSGAAQAGARLNHSGS
jgi:cytochrome c-type biogenesis protein CcmE